MWSPCADLRFQQTSSFTQARKSGRAVSEPAFKMIAYRVRHLKKQRERPNGLRADLLQGEASRAPLHRCSRPAPARPGPLSSCGPPGQAGAGRPPPSRPGAGATAGGEGPLASEPPEPGSHRRGCGTLCCSPAACPAPPRLGVGSRGGNVRVVPRAATGRPSSKRASVIAAC